MINLNKIITIITGLRSVNFFSLAKCSLCFFEPWCFCGDTRLVKKYSLYRPVTCDQRDDN